jgi:hypothetical protein
MLRSHAALCVSTGNLEMSVFQTLFAGKIGQPASVAAGSTGAPGPFGTDAAATPAQAAMMPAESTSTNGLV